MRLTRIVSRLCVGILLGVTFSATAMAQAWTATGGGDIVNPNPGGNVGINLGPAGGGAPTACDPLHVGNRVGAGLGTPAAIRLSGGNTILPGAGCVCEVARLGFEPIAGGGGVFAPGVSSSNDVVLVTGDPALAPCGEDVILATFGQPDGAIRFATQDTAGVPPAARGPLVEWMTIMGGTGYVGLDNVNPSERLDVNGNARISDSLKLDATSTLVLDGNPGQWGDVPWRDPATGILGWTGSDTTFWRVGGNTIGSVNSFIGSISPSTGDVLIGARGTTGITIEGNTTNTAHVGVNATPDTNWLKVGGDFFVTGTAYVAGDVWGNGSILTSDARLKQNVATLDGALAKVLLMRGVGYDFRQDLPNWTLPTTHQIGFVAQELQGVIPEAVAQDADGYLGVRYTMVIPVLVEAMKEQQRTIEEQRREISALNVRLLRLEQRLNGGGAGQPMPDMGANDSLMRAR